MYRKLIVVVLLFCYALHGNAQLRAIDSLVKEEMRMQHITGLSLGIVKNGRVLVSKGYGFARINDAAPATDTTVYKLASLSKEIIATCILVLAEQGKLDLSDHINKYLPDAPRKWENMTIRNLLNHTSGLERESPAFDWMIRQPDSVVIHAAYRNKLLFAPGAGWSYSNVGYFVLADIIRKVSGASFEDYMNNFFATCGLTHTTTTTKSRGPNKATGYIYNEGMGTTTPAIDYITLRPSGAFATCITDMIKWDSMIGQSSILTKQDWAKMWEDTVRAEEREDGSAHYYGYGWGVSMRNGHRVLTHKGDTPGFTNEYWKFIDDKTSIIILTNANKVSPGRLARKIAYAVDGN